MLVLKINTIHLYRRNFNIITLTNDFKNTYSATTYTL